MGIKYKVALCDPPVTCYEGPVISRAGAISQGAKRYSTGEPCKYGHIDERYTFSTMCLRCERERHRTESYHEWAANYQRSYIPEPSRRHNSTWQRAKRKAKLSSVA